MMSSQTEMDYINNRVFRTGFSSINILKEVSSAFADFSPFYEILDGESLRMFAGGILQLALHFKVNSKGKKKVEEEIDPQVLSMDHLEIGCVFCLIPLSIGALAFLVEFLIP